MNRKEKAKFISDFSDVISKYPFMLVAKQSGISVPEISNLRKQVKASDGLIRVVKNSLAKLALKDDFSEELIDMFSGPVAVFFSKDAVSSSKIAIGFAKINAEKFKIVGGVLDGKMIDRVSISEMASIPSLPELYGKLLGTLIGNVRQLMGTINAPAGQLVSVLDAYSKKQKD